MSGVLLSVAFYAILRVKVIADAALGTGFARIAAGCDRARLPAGGRDPADRAARLQTDAGLLQHRAHGAARTGRRHRRAARHRRGAAAHAGPRPGQEHACSSAPGTSCRPPAPARSRRFTRLATRAPVLAGCFAAGVLALIGFPPFSVFASELGIARAGFGARPRMAHRDRFRARPRHRRHPGRPHQPDAARPLPRHLLPRRPPTRRTWCGHRDPHHAGEHRCDAGGRAPVCAAIGVSAPPLDHLLHLAADVLTGTP